MIIKREIDGKTIEIKLTNAEIIEAYTERSHSLDVFSVKVNWKIMMKNLSWKNTAQPKKKGVRNLMLSHMKCVVKSISTIFLKIMQEIVLSRKRFLPLYNKVVTA